jgi:hypothetical protein
MQNNSQFYCFKTNALCGCREPAILEEDEEMEKQQLQQQQQQPANNPAPLDTETAPNHSGEDREQQQLGSIPESGEEKGMQETEGEKEEEEEEERLTPPLPKENKVKTKILSQ